MIRRTFVNIIIVYFVTCTFGLKEHENVITFSLNSGGNEKLLKLPENSTTVIEVINISSITSYITVQTHAQTKSLLLSEDATPFLHNSISGENIGLIYKLKNSESKAQMWLMNKNEESVSTLIIVSAVNENEPIPGGCNMEFPTEIAPYLKIKFDSTRLYLEYQHASLGAEINNPPPPCSYSLTHITYDIYVLFLKEGDFGEEEYFDKIAKMNNISSIKQYSSEVQSYSVHPDTRLSFLKYKNVGAVYNVVAKSTVNGIVKESAYVPIATYGCDLLQFSASGCRLSYSFGGKLFLFLLSMGGFTVAFFGCLYFGPTVFFFGFLASFFIGLTLLVRCTDLEKNNTVGIACIIGIIVGTIWCLIWIRYRIYLLSLLLLGLVLGFLLTATVFYTPLGNFEIFMNDRNYWALLSTGTLLVTVIFLSYPTVMTILGSSIVGSYMMLLFYDEFIGTRLSYIILNIMKRAVLKDFGFTSNDYPFQAKDIAMSATWVFIALLAILIQWRRQRSRVSSICDKRFFQFHVPANSIIHNSRASVRGSECANAQQPLISNQNNAHYQTFHP